jgi:hypothetical protein
MMAWLVDFESVQFGLAFFRCVKSDPRITRTGTNKKISVLCISWIVLKSCEEKFDQGHQRRMVQSVSSDERQIRAGAECS